MTDLVRRRLLQGLAASAATLAISPPRLVAAETRHVDWLREIQSPPKNLPANSPKLVSPLIDAAGQRITDREQWKKHRQSIHSWWQDFLGDELPGRDHESISWKVLEEDKVGGVKRQRIAYETEPGISTEAYLCLPEMVDRRPAVVVLHSTVDYSIYQPAGFKGPAEKMFGLQLAKQGYVTLSPRNFLWPQNEGIAARQEATRFLQRAPGRKGMRKMLHDAQVAVDLLEQLPGVDAARIGSVGHSLGAKEVLYLAAFDPRVKATVSSEGGVGIGFSNWEADWYLGPTVKTPGIDHDHHELLALCAPRPFLLIGGESADGDRGWPYIEAGLEAYRLYTDQPALGLWNHRQGHAVPAAAVQRISEWFEAYL
jgi:hypothetical protein